MKVFPRGQSSFAGLIVGFPQLDVPPYGLGFRILKSTFIFDWLGGVQVPRLDLERRAALSKINKKILSASQQEIVDAWEVLDGATDVHHFTYSDWECKLGRASQVETAPTTRTCHPLSPFVGLR